MTAPVQIETLRSLAAIVPPGPWIFTPDEDVDGGEIESFEGFLISLSDDDTAAYIAAASPDIILWLIERSDRLSKMLAQT